LERLAVIHADFQAQYAGVVQRLMLMEKRLVLCTIYDSVPNLPARERTALALFNDVIIRESFRASVPLIDLRFVCTDPDDYSNLSPIEPSALGGRKLANAIHRTLFNPLPTPTVTRC
jgi:hypothetical protein